MNYIGKKKDRQPSHLDESNAKINMMSVMANSLKKSLNSSKAPPKVNYRDTLIIGTNSKKKY